MDQQQQNTAIFAFSKPVPGSTVASSRIALFLAGELRAPLYYDAQVQHLRARTLFIVNGAFAFCNCLPQLAQAILQAENIVWVQNDYTIAPPKATSAGESPFRAAFRLRAQRGQPPMDFWTTVRALQSATPNSRYVNWNSLTWDPQPLHPPVEKHTLFYYGAHRAGRVPYFERYLNTPGAVVSSTAGAKFAATCPKARLLGGVGGAAFYPALGAHALGLYIEDERSHHHFHSPANRFYEMLSAGLPMVFQPQATAMLAEAGFDVEAYTAEDGAAALALTGRRAKWQAAQRAAWGTDYAGLLRSAVQAAAASYRRAGAKKAGV